MILAHDLAKMLLECDNLPVFLPCENMDRAIPVRSDYIIRAWVRHGLAPGQFDVAPRDQATSHHEEALILQGGSEAEWKPLKHSTVIVK